MRLLILGTGGMANQHAEHFAKIDGVTLVGGVDVDFDFLIHVYFVNYFQLNFIVFMLSKQISKNENHTQ